MNPDGDGRNIFVEDIVPNTVLARQMFMEIGLSNDKYLEEWRKLRESPSAT
jgi:hypothetical protein